MRRVVVTGMGMITAIGCGVNDNWKNLISSTSGIKLIDSFETDDLPSKVGGVISDDLIDKNFSDKEKRKMDKFILYSLIATEEAIKNSGCEIKDDNEASRSGVIIGSGIGGLSTIYENSILLKENGPRKISPFFIPSSLINLASGQVSIKYNFKGPNHSTVTACASGAHAIGDSFRLIQTNKADLMIAGGAEAATCRIGMAGFCALRALSTKFNNNPESASRPFDEKRDGFVMGDGAGILILEEFEHAKKRNAKIYAEVTGYGMSADAFHMTLPSETGEGAHTCMKNAIADAGINSGEINYINAHGTSTPAGDVVEVRAIKSTFREESKELVINSTKSMIGHLLGAAGGVEAIVTILSIVNDKVHPTINIFEQDPECDLDFNPDGTRDLKIKHALTNSFGFGGTNGSLVFSKYI